MGTRPSLETDVSGALRSCFSFSYGLPVSERSAAAFEEKKMTMTRLSLLPRVMIRLELSRRIQILTTHSSVARTAKLMVQRLRFIGNVVFYGSLLLRRRLLPPEQEHLSGL